MIQGDVQYRLRIACKKLGLVPSFIYYGDIDVRFDDADGRRRCVVVASKEVVERDAKTDDPIGDPLPVVSDPVASFVLLVRRQILHTSDSAH